MVSEKKNFFFTPCFKDDTESTRFFCPGQDRSHEVPSDDDAPRVRVGRSTFPRAFETDGNSVVWFRDDFTVRPFRTVFDKPLRGMSPTQAAD